MWPRIFGPACRGSGNCQVHNPNPVCPAAHMEPNGFSLGREIVCLNFLKADLYLTLIQGNWKGRIFGATFII
jgi:hypothetical protein